MLNPTPILTGVVSKLSAQNSVFSIKLTSQQLSDLTNNKSDTTVQLRFCLKDITCEQNDNFPSNLKLKVNGKMCALPNPLPMKAGQPQRYLPGPINITDHLKSSASVLNLICCDWNTEFNRVYVVSCYMVCTSQSILSSLY